MSVDAFGLAPAIVRDLTACFERFEGIECVWMYGSRARGDHRNTSDIDLMVNAPSWNDRQFSRLWAAVDDLQLLCGVDLAHWQSSSLSPEFRTRIERDRQLFWEPRRHAVQAPALLSTQLKDFQTTVLGQLDQFLAELNKQKVALAPVEQALRAMENTADLLQEASDFPKKNWAALKNQGLLPPAFAHHPHSSRFDGARRAIPNVCLKVPTGGGKTLLAAASVGRVFSSYLARHTGLVLWIVPNEAIYRQTLKTLANRDHPYRQMLNTAGAGRVKILEKDSPLTRLDVDSHLCVMLLMLQSAARKDEAQKKLKAFRDRGNVLGFTPREDDIEAHWQLLQDVPNLDAYTSWGISQAEARATKGSIVKSSLGNVLRLVQPMVVIDEGHHAYSENALRTLDGFNPCFMLELSATPRIGTVKTGKAQSGSNILVDVRGTDLEAAEMIKLPINVDVRPWADWQSCLAASLTQLNALAVEAAALQAETNRYIRPILLVQVERTGKDQRESGFIHAEDTKAFLPRVTWVEPDAAAHGVPAQRRELSYESDILSQIDWAALQTDALARTWAPDTAAFAGLSGVSGWSTGQGTQLQVGLDVLEHPQAVPRQCVLLPAAVLDRARLVRGLSDIASNAWWVWAWVDTVCARLLQSYDERALAASSASLLERLRIDLEAERDRLAQTVFDAGVSSGKIEFRLRADACDYEIPTEFTLALSGKLQPMARDDGQLIEKSLFEPVVTALTDSGLERDVACYLDSQAALQWWHRNVAKTQYGLQGWKRNKVYPDFVFARMGEAGTAKLVVLETKGLHLAGANDTVYKQALLARLTQAFADESLARVGGLELVAQPASTQSVQCDLVFGGDWRGTLNARQFAASATDTLF